MCCLPRSSGFLCCGIVASAVARRYPSACLSRSSTYGAGAS
jgi:hypothetical protein